VVAAVVVIATVAPAAPPPQASGDTTAVAAVVVPEDAAGAAEGVAGDGVGVADRTGLQLGGGVLADPAAPVLELAASRFVGDLVEIGVRQEVGFATGSGPHDWHLATTPFVDLHLLRDPKPRWSPFVGVAGGALYDDRDLAATVGPEAGVRILLGDGLGDLLGGGAYLAARYQYRWASQRVGGVGRDAHLVTLSVGWLLGDDPVAELRRIEAAAARAEAAATRAEESVARLEAATERLERAVDAWVVWFEQQLRK